MVGLSESGRVPRFPSRSFQTQIEVQLERCERGEVAARWVREREWTDVVLEQRRMTREERRECERCAAHP